MTQEIPWHSTELRQWLPIARRVLSGANDGDPREVQRRLMLALERHALSEDCRKAARRLNEQIQASALAEATFRPYQDHEVNVRTPGGPRAPRISRSSLT